MHSPSIDRSQVCQGAEIKEMGGMLDGLEREHIQFAEGVHRCCCVVQRQELPATCLIGGTLSPEDVGVNSKVIDLPTRESEGLQHCRRRRVGHGEKASSSSLEVDASTGSGSRQLGHLDRSQSGAWHRRTDHITRGLGTLVFNLFFSASYRT